MRKILFINHDIVPYVPETETSVMGKKVAHEIQEKGNEIRTFMPKWGIINERRGQLHEVIRLSGLNIVIDDLDHPTLIKVASIPQTKIQVYFIDSEDYFIKRKMIYDEDGTPYADNAERAIFFARAVIETVKKLRWTPDVIHCQGWMSSLVPFYLKKAYHDEPAVCEAKIVTSVFGDNDIAPLNESKMKELLAFRDITPETLSAYSDTFTGKDLTRLALEHSDGIIEASADINAEIKDIIANCNAKHLEYPGEDFADAYINFYDSLFAE